MAEERIFVGRKKELEQFGKVLEDPKGQAVLVVGQAGMGKTWLTHKMAEVAENHPHLKCGWVRYEVTPTDSVDSTMALMMDNAFDSAQVTERSFDGTERRLEQWRSFLNVFNLGDLVLSLRRDPAKNTREQFLERLRLISKRMPGNGRAVFIIDPEKYMQKESDQSWAIVVKNLPEEIKKIHPVEMYIKPVVDSDLSTGDILRGNINGDSGYWVVLTPSCDFEHQKAKQVLMAKCFLLEEQTEYTKYYEYLKGGNKPSKIAMDELFSLLSDNRKTQPERFKFLPGTFFVPDLVVDFQHLIQIPLTSTMKMEQIASLDSPYNEALIARFARYYGRIGTPDLDIDFVISRIESSLTNTR